MGAIVNGLISVFTGGKASDVPSFVQQQQPTPPPAPTPALPAPDRSDADIQAAAAAQRKKYSGGGRTPTNLTGGLGVPTSSTYSAVANLLGA